MISLHVKVWWSNYNPQCYSIKLHSIDVKIITNQRQWSVKNGIEQSTSGRAIARRQTLGNRPRVVWSSHSRWITHRPSDHQLWTVDVIRIHLEKFQSIDGIAPDPIPFISRPYLLCDPSDQQIIMQMFVSIRKKVIRNRENENRRNKLNV